MRKPLTQEHKDKISASTKGRTVSEETRLKMSLASKGRKKSEEHKKSLKIAKARKRLIRLEAALAETQEVLNGNV